MVKTSVNVPRIGKTTWNCSKVNIFLIIYYFPFFVGYGKSEGKFKWLMSLKRSVCGSLRLFEKKIKNEIKNMWSYLKSKWVYDFRFLESRIFWVCDWKSLTHLIKIERAINQSHIDVNWLNHGNSVIFIMNYKRYNGLNRNGDRKIAIIIYTIIDAYSKLWILCGRRLMFWAYVLWKAPQTHPRHTKTHMIHNHFLFTQHYLVSFQLWAQHIQQRNTLSHQAHNRHEWPSSSQTAFQIALVRHIERL